MIDIPKRPADVSEADWNKMVESANAYVEPNSSDLFLQFMRMTKTQQKEFLEKALNANDNAAWRKGSGVEDGTAKKSRNSLRNNSDLDLEPANESAIRDKAIMTELRQNLRKIFPEANDATFDFIVETFNKAATAKARHFDKVAGMVSNGLVEDVAKLIGEYGGCWMLDNDEADIVEALAEEVERLEAEHAQLLEQNARNQRWLAEHERQQRKRANDEVQRRRNKPPKRSRIEEDLGPQESNEVFNEEKHRRHNNAMQQYLNVIERDSAFMKK